MHGRRIIRHDAMALDPLHRVVIASFPAVLVPPSRERSNSLTHSMAGLALDARVWVENFSENLGESDRSEAKRAWESLVCACAGGGGGGGEEEAP